MSNDNLASICQKMLTKLLFVGRGLLLSVRNILTVYWNTKNSPNNKLFKGIASKFSLLLTLVLLMGISSPAQAATKFCSQAPFNGVIDGVVLGASPTQITIDTDCTFQNWTFSNPLTATINFQTNDPTVYLIVFDNVIYDGNLACSSVDHAIWIVNSTFLKGVAQSCQDLLIPVETIAKQAPATTASIGVPFTYTLTLPSMQFPAGAPSANTLHDIILWDDLTATGVDLTYVSINAYYKSSGLPVTLVQETNALSKGGVWTNKNLSYEPIGLIPFGEQIMVEITVVLDNTPANVAGTTFINTAKWWFGRLIDIDGVPTFFDPLPGESGVSTPMTIAEPNLVVAKTSNETALNVGVLATFTIDVQNTGGSDAWNVTLNDLLPDFPSPPVLDLAGMCDFDPSVGLTAQIFAADGTTPIAGALIPNIDYSVTYVGAPTCQLSLTMLTPAAVIGATQRLIITYQSQLDADTIADGFALTNIAGATEWFSADGSYPTKVFNRSLTDGTPTIIDHEDSYTITTGLSGYFFQKTVENLTTGANPATRAAPGDRLRYKLRVFNVDQIIDNITINDILDPSLFNTATSFSMISLAAGSTFSFNNTTGELLIFGNGSPLNLSPPAELLIEFEIDLALGLANGTVVPNQAHLTADAPFLAVDSDDPFINGIADPLDPLIIPDATNVVIQTPGALSKVNTQVTATIGEQFTYTITIPANPVDTPLFDVKIFDDLSASNADMRFISAAVVSGGSWTLSNTGTDTAIVIEDIAVGIDIPANVQAVIEITVELQNSAINQSGLLFNNSATYTYNRSNDNNATQTAGEAGSSIDMTVVEPDLTSVTKVGTLVTAAPVSGGSIIEYVITMLNGGDSTAYDVNVVDTLPAELALDSTFTPTATIGGIPVVGFIATPTDAPAGPLIWGFDNADVSLDIPAGSTLVLTYRAQVQISTAATFNNSVAIDWTSLDGSGGLERTGFGCPTITAPNDYCATAIGNSFSIIDSNSLIKSVVNDSWISDGSTAFDSTLRIGDTATYRLSLNLGEGTTKNVIVSDVLDIGLEFVEIVSINSDITAPYSSALPFNHTDFTAPSIVGNATIGTAMTWALGDIYNTPDGDNTNDTFVIEYRVRVANTILTQINTSTLNNTATLGYDDGSGVPVIDPLRLVSTTALTLWQPNVSVTKSVVPAGGDTIVVASELIAYTVDVVNNGLAPAYDTVLEDIIPVGLRDGAATITMVSTELLIGGALTNLAPTYDAVTGIAIWDFDSNLANQYTIPVGDTLRIIYTVQADALIGPGLTLTNAVTATLYYSFDDEAVPLNSIAANREIYGSSNTATTTLTTAPGTPLKENPADASVTIGQEFTYTITVPNTSQPMPLYDVRVLDDLSAIAADVTLLSIDNLSGGAWVPVSASSTNLIIEDTTSGIDIPANGQIVIGVTLRLDNTTTNNAGVTFNNTAAYTYNQVNGDVGTQLNGGSSTTANMTIVEPTLVISKVGTPTPAVPVTGGSIIQYVISMNNTGSDTAYDVNVVDTLPAELALDTSFTPTATIGGVPVVGFNSTPSGSPIGPLVWGKDNADQSLDIPTGSTLLLTYQAQVQNSSAATFNNTAQVDWTSLNAVSSFERTGTGCPTIVAPNDYCSSAASTPITIIDNNSLSKTIISDSYVDGFSTANDATARIGDTATYQLVLNIGEGITNSVRVSDLLPTGMSFDSLVGITASAGSNFAYTLSAQPTVGDTGTLLWDFGNITNTANGTPLDTLTIEYIVKILPNAGIAQVASSTLINTATFIYLDGGGLPVVDPARLESSATLNLWQPVMSAVIKTGNGAANNALSPLNVAVATDTVLFQLESCNAAAASAPAYNIILTDVLASQLDETSIAGLTVNINGGLAAAGVDYTYTPPAARGGSLQIDLLTAVNPGQCVTVDYSIGFHTDFGPNQVWNNSVTLDEYWSLPAALGQQYLPSSTAQFFMTNLVNVEPLAKSLVSPASEATIGESVIYQITVPAVPVNAVLDNVVVTEALHGALEYINATAVDGGGSPVVMIDSTVGQNVSLTIAQIPAGEQVIITLNTQLANNSAANAGVSFTNTSAYTYTGVPVAAVTDGTSGALLIIEPTVAIAKTVLPLTAPNAGDILTYSLTFTANGGAFGDNFSDAFDLRIDDSLSLGLAYQIGTSSVTGGSTIANPTVTGDGITTAQTLVWSLADGTADIDIVEGTVITVTYDVIVLDSVQSGQDLTNSATVQWTGLDTIIAAERTGTGTPVENDYFTNPVTTTLTTLDNTTLIKTRQSDTYGALDTNVRIGDLVDYELRIHLDEGSHSSLILSDVLPQGLQFEQVLSINGDAIAPYSAVAPFTYSDIATPNISGTATTEPTTVTWTLGDVVNVGDNNVANDDFVIVYRARVLNLVFAQTNTTALTNTATLNYTIATGSVNQFDTESITLLQPNLTVSKSVAAAGGDTIIDASELITYTVDVTNNGLAPAYDSVIEDIIPIGLRDGAATITMVSTELLVGGALVNLTPAYDPLTGIAIWNFNSGGANTYTIPAGDTLRIVYQVQADANLGPGLTLTNAATATLYYSFDDEAVPTIAPLSGVRDTYGPSNTATSTLTTPLPGGPLKQNPATTTVTIGEEFTYTITVPETPLATALHDVRILDNISLVTADLTLVSVSKISVGGAWVPINTGTVTNLIIEDTVNGIDIPANEQIVIGVTVRLDNSATNNDGVTFSNSASYTYNQIDGDNLTQLAGGSSATTDMTIVEPLLTITKVGTLITPVPVIGGSVIEYVVSMTNSGSATAYDVNVVDILPPELAFYASFTPVATIGGTPVGGFSPSPSGAPNGPLIWGQGNTDGSLDLAAGSTLLLTYRTQVQTSSAAIFDNTVWIDWSSLDNASVYERTGSGCPTIAAPNDYCATATSLPFSITDNNSLIKTVTADSWITDGSTALDATVRIGDTASYQIALNLGEGTTSSVIVSDVLPTGVILESFSINPASGGGSFTYSVTTPPLAGATGTLVWNLGDIINAPSNDATPVDTLIIEYVIRVIENNINTIAQIPSTLLTNTATLSYSGSGSVIDPSLLVDTANLTIWQPVMSTVSKVERTGLIGTVATPLNVNVATDIVQFQLESCNTSGLAPSYNLLLSDVLASQLDETSIAGLTVNINGALATAGVDYIYTPPAGRGGTLQIELITAVNPGQCVTVDYDIGFHTDFGPNQVWNNSVTLDEYWSLPASLGQQYLPSSTAQFFMTNLVNVEPLAKSLVSPATEVTIGESVVYQITVPAVAVNSVLDNVVVTDVLHGALEYINATAVDNGGSPVVMAENVVAQNVGLTIAQIPAGEQVIITLNARLANNSAANAGVSFTNTAVYTYTGIPLTAVTGASSGALLIVEPTVAIAKTVSPNTTANAGDILTYSLTFTASGGGLGDNFSNAFDLQIDDNLSLGLAYQTGTATVNGVGNTISDPSVIGDGVTTAQSLLWRLEDSTADIDIVEGSIVTVTYDVLVLNSILAGQTLSNSANAQWTGLDAVNSLERNGSATPVENDYFTATVTTSVNTLDNTTLAKTRLSDTYNAVDSNIRIGDIIDYELRIHLDEGSLSGLILSDVLPRGLQFEQVVSINGDTAAPYSSVVPFSHANINTPSVSGSASAGATTVTWTLGNITNASDGNASNDDFVIIYRARVLNLVFAQTNSTNLNNTATLNYNAFSGAVSQVANTNVTIQQPNLTVSKIAAPANGDTIVDASELITYTVDVVNSGLAPAYDTVIEDIIPLGLRQAGVTTSSITLVNAGISLPILAPTFILATGIATWNLDSGIANQYNIPVGETLRIVYQVQADVTLGAGLTLTNAVTARLYYSFDDEATPSLGGVTGVREIYGASNTATTTLTTALPGALLKQTTQPLGVVGQVFSYRITIPETPQTVALNDVRITDDLNLSAADLSFVSVSKISGSQPWTPVNTGDAKNLVIEDTTIGIDIPAGEQVVIEINLVLDNTAINISGLVFNNTAVYTSNSINDDNTSQLPGLPSTSGDMTIAGPDSVTLEKTGPATMRVGLAASFTLNVQNTGSAPAWDLTITDQLPNITNGGMCATAPTNITAQIFQADATTAVSPVLTQGTDYIVSFNPDPICTLVITMQTAAGAIGATERLIVNYDASLDTGTITGINLTNIAAATEWFSADTSGSGATGAIRTYTGVLSDGTIGTLDEQDAYTVLTELPVLLFQKTVVNVTSGQDPGSNAQPGDILRYSIHLENLSAVALTNFSIIDELDALNTSALFEPGSLNLVTLPTGADSSNSDPNGGTNGSGLVDIRNLNLQAQGNAGDTLDLSFEATLVSVINNATVVLNQAHLDSFGLILADTDDPNVNGADDPNLAGDEDPTETLINSAPIFEVFKTSEDITGDPNILQAGDTLRYTIRVKNIGDENAINVSMRDQIPANTTYVANSTTLNGGSVVDPATDTSPLQDGMLINAPEDTTPGAMRADATPSTTSNIATIIFDVVVNSDVLEATIISNQAFVSGDGGGGEPVAEVPSDDPDTQLIDDPTLDIVGNLPLVDAQKLVEIQVDNGSIGIVDPGDVLRYTITITNAGAIAATNVVFSDAVPANTTYVADSVMLNGLPVAQPDAGVSPLTSGIAVSSSDLTPPLPTLGNGVLSPNGTATITFDVIVNVGVAAGVVISNQGVISNDELPDELTDFDGIDSNGDQPTDVVVGSVQLLTITKQVFVVGGGIVEAGGELEYVIRVTNIASIPANNVVITDNLDLPVAGQMTYVAGTGLLNGLAAGVSFASPILTGDYSTTYGDLASGEIAELRFRVLLSDALPLGTTLTNIGEVSWNSPTVTASASVSIDVGGSPGSINLNGQVWHDVDFSNDVTSSEALLQGWTVELYANNVLLNSVLTDLNGNFSFTGLLPNLPTGNAYELRYFSPNAVATTATLGQTSSIFTNGAQKINDILGASGGSLHNLNLPIQPNGVVYDSILRVPVAGVRLSMINQTRSNQNVPASCYEDPIQQNQLTLANGYYKFDLNFSDPLRCAEGDEYVIQIQPPATGFVGTTSQIIPPAQPITGVAQDVPNCPATAADQIPATAQHCENSSSFVHPDSSIAPDALITSYYLKFLFNNAFATDQIFNNHIPVDSELGDVVAISKVSGLQNVTRSQLVPYVITLNNTLTVPLYNLNVIDNFPAGFKYVAGSSRVASLAVEPQINGRELTWPDLNVNIGETVAIKLLLVVGSGVGEGEYINTAHVINSRTGDGMSGIASATVRLIPDPTFDCSDVIGKVFDDRNKNAYQDEGEKGIAGVQVATARGLRVTTDKQGRFHITCAVVPSELRGSNFIMKVDDRSLPSGYRITTENPRVQRATRGKMLKFNFGATIHKVVRLDLANGVFEKGSTQLRPQWRSRIDLLLTELEKDLSILRLSYLAENETESLVDDRLDAIEEMISERWDELNCCYKLMIEKEVFWRKGKPSDRGTF